VGKGKVYATRYGKIRVVRVGNQTFKLDKHGNPLPKVSTSRKV
jgi:hypothetical protein